jgi:RHS repeat-associated protein
LYASAQTNYGSFTPAPPTNQYAYKFHYNKYGRLDIAANTHNTNWSIGVTNPTTYDLNGNPAEHRGISQTTLNLTQLQRASMGSKPYAYKSGTNTPQTIGGWNYGADATGNPAEHRGISQTTLNITFATSSGITMTYDPFTELTMREVKGGERQNYQYDGKKERVLKIDSVTSGGNTIVTKTLYIQGLNDYPLMVLNGSTEYVYVYGIGGIAAMRVQGWWYYVMRDHLGSTKLIISNTSFVAARYEYDPYGKILDTSSITTGSNYQFTGQELDETGLYNFRARMYDTSAAIFYAADPANQGYSRYGYCGGNPVIMVDPTGKYWEPNYYVDGVQISSEDYYENYASHVDTYMLYQQHGMFNNANHQRQHQRDLAQQRKDLTKLSLTGNSMASQSGGSVPRVSINYSSLLSCPYQWLTYLIAAAVGEATWNEKKIGGLNDQSIIEMAQIIYVVLNSVAANYNDNTTIEDIVTDPGRFNGIKNANGQYVLQGGYGNVDLDARKAAAWEALYGVVFGSIPNLVGTSRFLGSIDDFNNSDTPVFAEARGIRNGNPGLVGVWYPHFQFISINSCVFFDDPHLRPWGR